MIDSGLMLTASSLNYEIDVSVATVITEYGTSYPISYQEKCYRRGAVCWQDNPLKVFAAANITSFANVNREYLLWGLNYVEQQKRLGHFPNVPEVDAVFGGIVRNPVSGAIVGAHALSFLYYLRNEEILNSQNEYVDSVANAWEAHYLRLVDYYNINSIAVPIHQRLIAEKFATRSFEDEFGKTIDGDLMLLNIAITIILFYAILMMSRWDLGFFKGIRFSLSLGAVISVGCAIAAAYGFCSYVGLFFSKLMNLLPFLLLGIGVDDAFILIQALDNVPSTITIISASGVKVTRRRNTVEMIAMALSTAGPSITVTSLTDFFAFVIGSNTSLPALRNFSIYAAFGILFDFALQITLFVAFMTLDRRRMEKNVSDVVCFFHCSECLGSGESTSEEISNTSIQPIAVTKKTYSMTTFFGDGLSRFLSNKAVKAFVVLFGLGLLAIGISGTVQIPVQADIDNFIPENSYLADWYNALDAYYKRIGASVGVYTVNFDFFDNSYTNGGNSTLHRLALNTAFRANTYVSEDSINDWFVEFTSTAIGQHALSTNNKSYCYESLYTWLSTPTALGGGMIYQNDIKFVDSNQPHLGVLSSRALGNHLKTDRSQKKVEMMDSLRTSVAATLPIGVSSFVYSDEYIQWEQYKAVAEEAIRNVSLILAVVFVITFLLLARPICSTIVFACIAATVVEIIGFMYYWDLTIDSVTVIMLVISLGLSVDYSVHIGHAFLTSIDEKNDGNTRMKMALRKQGAAVFNGAFSTWLAVVTLASSESYVFVTFFKQLFLCTTFGLFHGLIVLPVLLSLANPKHFSKKGEVTSVVKVSLELGQESQH